MYKKASDVQETPTTETFIDIVIARVPICDIHEPEVGGPCYRLPISVTKDSLRLHNWGVCDKRARKAGFIGTASSQPPAPKKFHSKYNRTA